MHEPPTPHHLVISISPFSKWGINFITCIPTSFDRHSYIVVVVDYFKKWVEVIPTFPDDEEIIALFLFNQVICCFGVPHTIITNHGYHFQNHSMHELTSLLYFHKKHSSSYYPQGNGQVEVVNGILKTMIYRLVGNHKTRWHRMLYPALWEY